MQREKVTSEAIASIGYNEEDATLEVEFAGGGVYDYFDVGPDVWEAFREAESKGAFFSAEIRGAYLYSQVR